MEIKFFDRIKAFERLGEFTTKTSDEGLSFYQALEKSVMDIKDSDKNG